jgi:ATP-dependent RNA helicase RhlE
LNSQFALRSRSRHSPRRRPQSPVAHTKRADRREPSTAFVPASYDATPLAFDALNLDARIRRAVAHRGFTHTTPIQSATFSLILGGADVIACAQTGTGKTAAFLLPIMQRLLACRADGDPTARTASTRVLVLAPTRELAAQIDSDLDGFAYDTGLSSVAVYGGVGASAQAAALRAPADVVVATPGRLLDHLRAGAARLDGVEVLVLDEADRMLDMGFWPDVRRIIATLPARRQTLLFSATMSRDVMQSAAPIMREPKVIQVGGAVSLPAAITHQGHLVRSDEKVTRLAGLLRHASGPTLVFVRTKRGADRLVNRLAVNRIHSAALHADRSQSQRTAALAGFRSGQHSVLVATDIAARGLDVDKIGHVVNYDFPPTVEAYVHRAGRTGRADQAGAAVSFITPDELPALRAVESSLGLQLIAAPDAAEVHDERTRGAGSRPSRPRS